MHRKLIIIFLLAINLLLAQNDKSLEIISNNSKSKFLNKENYLSDFSINFFISEQLFGGNIFLKSSVTSSSVLFEEFSFNKDIKKTELVIGKFHIDQHYDHELSSGGLINSKYAKPYFKFLLKRKFDIHPRISFTYKHSDGIFEKNSTYSEAPFIHQKSLYLDTKIKSSTISIGLVHVVTWAGTIEKYGKLPRSFDDYHNIFTGQKGASDSPISEQGNSLGDAWGIWDFYYNIHKGNNRYGLYYQHIFADRSGLEFKNGFDGLWGVFIEKNNTKNVYKILFEYLDTRDQSGNFHPPGGDSYYWNGMYSHGWKYDNRIIGNPFIGVFNNRVVLKHIGFSIDIKKTKLVLSNSNFDMYKSYNNRNFTQTIKENGGFFYDLGEDNVIDSSSESSISIQRIIKNKYSLNFSISEERNVVGSYFSIKYSF